METKPYFLMSPPREDWCLKGRANFRSQATSQVDGAQARREWTTLADAIVAAGGDVVVCPPHPKRNLTGMVYTAEAGEFYVDDAGEPRFVLPNMAVEHRTAEADWIGGFVAGLGFRTETIQATWEAQGDALRIENGDAIIHTFGSGKYARTTQQAYGEVSRLLSDRHIQIHFHADPWFHGNTFLGIYHAVSSRIGNDGTRHGVLVCPDALLPGELDRLKQFIPNARYLPISVEQSRNYDTNSLQVQKTVIASTTISESARGLFDELDLSVVDVDLSELFTKGGGAPVCLTNRLWGATSDHFPSHVLWSNAPSLEAH